MTDELLLQLRDALVGICNWDRATIAADVRERLARLNLLVLPGPQPMETAPRGGTRILVFGDCLFVGYELRIDEEGDPDWHIACWAERSWPGAGPGYWSDGGEGWIVGAKCRMPMPPTPDAATLLRIAKGVTPDMLANDRHPNGAPKWASDGTLLDDHGKRSIFDDVDE